MADDIFKEVDEELRAERLRAAGRRWGVLGLALVLLCVLLAGGWQIEAYRQRERAAASAAIFFEATKQADSSILAAGSGDVSAGQTKAAGLFAQVAARGPDGLRTLARLRQAQIAWQSGQHAQALGLWNAIHDDSDADSTLRGLASLLWVQHQMETGDPALLKSRLGALSGSGDAWRPMAQELDAELDLRLGHVDEARRKLAAIAQDGAAPEGLRNQAGGLNDTLDQTKTGG